jgi:hypothetical protein
VREVAMFKRACEERPRRRHRLELCAVVPEADDHGTRVGAAQRFKQDVDAFVVEELAEVHDRRLVASQKSSKPLRVPLIRQSIVCVAQVGWVVTRFRQQAYDGLVSRLGLERVHVDTGRYLVHAVDVPDDLFEHLTDVRGADVHGFRFRKRALPPGRKVFVATHRVLELRSMRLHRKGHPACRSDRRTEKHVVREDEVDRHL